MYQYKKHPRGYFTLFGFTQQPQDMWRRKLAQRLNIEPSITLDFGSEGHFFFYTSYGEVAQNEERLLLKLGFLRSPDKTPLSANDILAQQLITPQQINPAAIRGNALLLCVDKTAPRIAAFKNLLSTHQLFFRASADTLLAATNLSCLLDILDRVELNEEMIPYHFMFRQTPGPLTYFKDIHRFFPGQLLKWQTGTWSTPLVQDLRSLRPPKTFNKADEQSIALLYQEIKDIVAAYLHDTESSGFKTGCMLSGGVDSSILQLAMNDALQTNGLKSYSFAPQNTPTFNFEIEYVQDASKLLKTDHTLVRFEPQDYPNLVIDSIKMLGQPVLLDIQPCKLAVAQYLNHHNNGPQLLFDAQGADTLFGLSISKRLKMVELFRKIPGAAPALGLMGRLIKPFHGRYETFEKTAQILKGDPDYFHAPTNTITVYSNLELARKAFGDKVIKQTLAYRRQLEAQYLGSQDYPEQVYAIDLLTDTYEMQVQGSQLSLAQGTEQLYPFMDDDLIRMSYTFKPGIRYIEGFEVKALLKRILAQHGLSSIAYKPKGASIFTDDLYQWMQTGPLQEVVQDITRPDFLSQADYTALLKEPDHFLWALLTFDLFKKQVLG